MNPLKTSNHNSSSKTLGPVANQFVEALSRMLSGKSITLGEPILFGDATFSVLLVFERINGQATYRGTLSGDLVELLADRGIEFRLVTPEGHSVGVALIGPRGRLALPVEHEAVQSGCRCHIELAADATIMSEPSPSRRLSYQVPAVAAANTSDDVFLRQPIDVSDNYIGLHLAPDDAPLGSVLVWVSESSRRDIPLGQRELVSVPLFQSVKSGAYRSGQTNLPSLLPPGVNFDPSRHSIEVIGLSHENVKTLEMLSREQRILVENWSRLESDDRMTRADSPPVSRVLSADSSDDVADENL